MSHHGLASQGGPVQRGAVEKAHHRAAKVVADSKTTPPTSPERIGQIFHTPEPKRVIQSTHKPPVNSIAETMAAAQASTDSLLNQLKARAFQTSPFATTARRKDWCSDATQPSSTATISGRRATPAPLPVAAPVQRDPEELARAAALQRMSAGVATFAAQLDSAVAQIKAVALGRSTSSGTNADHDSTATFLFSCGCRKFRVGKAFCQTFSSVRVWSDRLEYDFVHPAKKERTHMIMFFKHMVGWKLEGAVFSFRLAHPLDCFTADYKVTNKAHVLSVKLDSSIDVEQFQAQVLPHLRQPAAV